MILHRAAPLAAHPVDIHRIVWRQPLDASGEADSDAVQETPEVTTWTITNDELAVPGDPAGRQFIAVRGAGVANAVMPIEDPDRPIEIDVVPAAALSGQLVDGATNAPIRAATLLRVSEEVAALLRPAAPANLPLPFVEAAIVREDGRFSFAAATTGPEQLRIEAAGFWPTELHGVDARTSPITIRLDPMTTLTGRVVDVDGRPLSGVTVVAGIVGRLPVAERVVAHSAPDGRFGAEVPATRVAVTALRDGYATTKTIADLTHGAASPLEIVMPTESILRGRVIDDSGRPVAEATIVVGCLTDHLVTGIWDTDTDGTFEMPWTAGGRRYHILVSKEGFEPLDDGPFTAPTTDLTLRLRRCGRIHGVVVDEAGRPVPRFTLLAIPESPVSFHEEAAWHGADPLTFDDPEGRFAVDGLPPRLCHLRVEAPGFAALHAVALPQGDAAPATGERLVLSPGRTFHGRLVDADGAPIVGAELHPTCPTAVGGTLAPAAARAVSTDGDGGFHIDGAPTLPFELLARRTDGGLVLFPDLVASDVPSTLRWPRTGALRGKIRSPHADPTTTLRVRAGPIGTREGLELRPDRDGSFAWNELPAGRWWVIVIDEWASTEAQAFVVRRVVTDIGEGASTRVDFDLANTGMIEGVVVADGSLADVRWIVEASQPERPRERISSSTEMAGRFVLAGLAPGRWHVAARSATTGVAALIEAEVDLAPEEPAPLLELVAPAQTVTLEVIDPASGQPLLQARATCVADPQAEATPARAGILEIALADTPSNALIVSAPGRALRRIEVDPADPGPHRVPLEPEARLALRVTAAGAPPPLAVRIRVEHVDPAFGSQEFVSRDGHLEVSSLPAGSLHLRAELGGAVTEWSGAVAVGERREVELDLAPPMPCDVLVVTTEGRARAGVEVVAVPQESARVAVTARTDDSGRARLWLGSGRWTVTCESSTAAVEARPDSAVNVTLRLE